ncbi:MAG TPA: YdgA family protein [Acidiferrobacterales bacterium]|nr:YdgA family protein [Acidiferrobacterales bacterium]
MNKLVTIVVVVVAVLIAAVAGLPYWFGLQAESAYQAMLQKLNDGGELIVNNSSFQRGWFESTADTSFTLTNLPTVSVSMLHRISHGPLPLDDEFQLQPLLARVKSQISIGLPGGAIKPPPMTGKTSVYLAGNSSTRIDMEPYNKPAPKAGETDVFDLEWKGLSGNYTLSADYKNLKGEFNAPVLRFSFKDGGFVLNKLSLSVDTQESASGLNTGNVALGVDKLMMDDRKKGESISLDGLRLGSDTQEAGGNLNSTLTFQFRAMESGDSKQGAAQINLQLRKLDVASLVKFQNEVRALRKQKMPPEQVNMMVLGKTMELLGQLAKKSPELEVTKLSFKAEDGEVTGKAKFVLDGSQLDVGGNPMLMLKALSGEGEISLPDSIVRLLAEPDVKRDLEVLKTSGKLSENEIAKLTPKRIAAITTQAIKELPQYRENVVSRLKLVADGPNYKIVAALKDGQLRVNNEPLQLP